MIQCKIKQTTRQFIHKDNNIQLLKKKEKPVIIGCYLDKLNCILIKGFFEHIMEKLLNNTATSCLNYSRVGIFLFF